LIASKSKDSSSKIGAVIVRDNAIISEGYNGLPRGVNDDVSVRGDKPEKYYWYEHAERNSIFHCARNGIATKDTTLYSMGCPCSDCTRAIIQSGIKEVVIHSQWEDIGFNNSVDKWSESTARSADMFMESSVSVKVFDKVLGVKTMVSGKIYNV
jgi:dCMP deaminase